MPCASFLESRLIERHVSLVKRLNLRTQRAVDRIRATLRITDVQPERFNGNAQIALGEIRQIFFVEFSHADEIEILHGKAPEELTVQVPHLSTQAKSLDRPILLHDLSVEPG